MTEEPGQHHGDDDENVPRDDGDDQPGGELAGDAQGNENRDDQQFIGNGIEIRAKLGFPLEALGEIAVHGIGNAGRDKGEKGGLKLS